MQHKYGNNNKKKYFDTSKQNFGITEVVLLLLVVDRSCSRNHKVNHEEL
jgi:hypothetical protein